MFTYSISDNIYQQVLIPLNKEKVYFYTMLVGLFLSIGLSILNVITIFRDNPMLGVSIATLISDIVVLVTLICVTRKHVFKNIFNTNNLKIVIATISIALFIYFIAPLLPITNPLLLIATMILIAGLIYVLVLFILKEDIVFDLLKKEKKRHE